MAPYVKVRLVISWTSDVMIIMGSCCWVTEIFDP